MKAISPLFASALLDPERRVVDVLVARLVYGEAVIRLANYEDALYLDVGDGDGTQRFEPVPFMFDTMESGGTMEVDRTSLTVPNVELLVQYSTEAQRTTLGAMVLNGVLDGTEIWRYQINTKNNGVFAHSRWDVVGACSITPTQVTIELQSALGRCVRPAPATVIQAACNNGLYDARCGLNRAIYTASAAATGGSRTHLTSALVGVDGHYALGEVQFTGGLNIGATRTIGKHTDDGSLFWARPLRFTVQAGDLFTACLGCDKTFATCTTKFLRDVTEGPACSECAELLGDPHIAGCSRNAQPFRGFPNIPTAETL